MALRVTFSFIGRPFGHFEAFFVCPQIFRPIFYCLKGLFAKLSLNFVVEFLVSVIYLKELSAEFRYSWLETSGERVGIMSGELNSTYMFTIMLQYV